MSADEAPALTDLPDAVRTQVVRWAAQVLPSVRPLPGSLRRVAEFAPARRARAGTAAVAAALDDSTFRHAVALQVSALPREQNQADDPVLASAWAWLQRPDGWEDHLSCALGELSERGRQPAGTELESFRTAAASAERDLRRAKEEHRNRLAEVRAENSQLRQRLGEARASARAAEARVAELEGDLARSRADSERESQALGKELRQVRSKLAELRSEVETERRGHRVARDGTSVRARLLLEVLGDAVSGLQRELALPPTTRLPADSVDALSAQDLEAEHLTARGADDAATLDHLLALPRVRLLVDGYNVAKAAWPTSTLEVQRIRLVTPLGALAARTGAETTVVFDAQHSAHRAPTPLPRGVRVVFSPAGVIADDVIVDYVRAEPRGRVVLVVTDDRELAVRVRTEGARVVGASTLTALLGR